MSPCRSILVALAAAVVVAGCAPAPPAWPYPDPVVSCDSVGGNVLYTPPAYTGGPPVTISALPGAALTGCSDNTGQGVAGGVITRADFGLINSGCEPYPPISTTLGSGGIEILWSNGATSQANAAITYGYPFSVGVWLVDISIVTGLWAGSWSSTLFHVTAATGNCAVPVVVSHIESSGPMVFHPPPT